MGQVDDKSDFCEFGGLEHEIAEIKPSLRAASGMTHKKHHDHGHDCGQKDPGHVTLIKSVWNSGYDEHGGDTESHVHAIAEEIIIGVPSLHGGCVDACTEDHDQSCHEQAENRGQQDRIQ